MLVALAYFSVHEQVREGMRCAGTGKQLVSACVQTKNRMEFRSDRSHPFHMSVEYGPISDLCSSSSASTQPWRDLICDTLGQQIRFKSFLAEHADWTLIKVVRQYLSLIINSCAYPQLWFSDIQLDLIVFKHKYASDSFHYIPGLLTNSPGTDWSQTVECPPGTVEVVRTSCGGINLNLGHTLDHLGYIEYFYSYIELIIWS